MSLHTLNQVEIEQVSGALVTDTLAFLFFAFGPYNRNPYDYYNAMLNRAAGFGIAQGGDSPTPTASGN